MTTPPDSGPGSFRAALTAATLLMLAGFTVLAVAMTLALSEADRLLDRLSRSHGQLALVTRLEADLNRSTRPRAADAGSTPVAAQLRAYTDSILAEAKVIGRDSATRAAQADEIARAQALADVVAQRQAKIQRGQPAAAEEQRLYALVKEIELREREESREALEEMRALRARATAMGGVVLALLGLLAGAGAWTMRSRVVRPLRALEEAADRFGRAEPPHPVQAAGFSEISKVGAAFDRLLAEVTAQRLVLSGANEMLEAKVAERTREAEASSARLTEIDRTRRLFFSKVGHELRTPTTIIRGEAEVALRNREATAVELREALEHIAANSAFLQRRLGDLVTLAQAEDGRISLTRERLDLAELLGRVVAMAEPYMRSTGMTLAAEGLEPSGRMVLGDDSWLQQALLAVIDNAAKHATGSHCARLRLRSVGGFAVVDIADGGSGVAPEALPFLFDSYYQAPGGTAAGGIGVGLSVTRWVAEQHGGGVTATTEAGSGLVVSMQLPWAR